MLPVNELQRLFLDFAILLPDLHLHTRANHVHHLLVELVGIRSVVQVRQFAVSLVDLLVAQPLFPVSEIGIDSLQASLHAILVEHLPLTLPVEVVMVHAVEVFVLQVVGTHLYTCSLYVVFTDKVLHLRLI